MASPARSLSRTSRPANPLGVDDATAEQILARLRRVEGQVRAIQRMIAERRECHETVRQMAAARAALDRAMVHLMVTSMAECIRSGEGRERDVSKLMDALIQLL